MDIVEFQTRGTQRVDAVVIGVSGTPSGRIYMQEELQWLYAVQPAEPDVSDRFFWYGVAVACYLVPLFGGWVYFFPLRSVSRDADVCRLGQW